MPFALCFVFILSYCFFFFFKQKTAYEMRISDWSSDVCSSVYVAGRDHVNNSRTGLAPSLGLGLNGDTRAYVNLLYVKQDNIHDGFVPTIGLPGWVPQPGQQELNGHPDDPEK